jgi:ABC-type amino acid transport substrate-binding protein
VVGVEGGSTGDLELRKVPGLAAPPLVISYLTLEAAFEDLATGRLGAAVTDVVTAREHVRQYRALRVIEPPFTEEPYVIAARRSDRSLMARIDEILNEMDRDGLLAALEKRWLP